MLSWLEICFFVGGSIGVLLHIACNPRLKSGSKYAHDRELKPPIASRWFSERMVTVGAAVGLAMILGSGAVGVYLILTVWRPS
jgi:hypothetical protein